jgi:hypothetical protein
MKAVLCVSGGFVKFGMTPGGGSSPGPRSGFVVVVDDIFFLQFVDEQKAGGLVRKSDHGK